MCVCVGGGGVRTRNVCVCVWGENKKCVCVARGDSYRLVSLHKYTHREKPITPGHDISTTPYNT